jgi:hypothetical protein
MNQELDAFDFERNYLADILELTGDHLASIQLQINPLAPEDNAAVFDAGEHIAGVAMVAAQRYMSSVCNWLSFPKKDALSLGPERNGAVVAATVDAAANYWKHIEDGERAVYPHTRKALEKAGVEFQSGYCVSNAIHKCGYKHLSEMLVDLVSWRDFVMLEVQKRNSA